MNDKNGFKTYIEKDNYFLSEKFDLATNKMALAIEHAHDNTHNRELKQRRFRATHVNRK